MRLYLLIKVSIIPKAARIDFTNPRPFYIQNFNPIQRRIVVDNRRHLRNYKKVKGELPAAIAAANNSQYFNQSQSGIELRSIRAAYRIIK